jgi:hypothetical protein
MITFTTLTFLYGICRCLGTMESDTNTVYQNSVSLLKLLADLDGMTEWILNTVVYENKSTAKRRNVNTVKCVWETEI